MYPLLDPSASHCIMAYGCVCGAPTKMTSSLIFAKTARISPPLMLPPLPKGPGGWQHPHPNEEPADKSDVSLFCVLFLHPSKASPHPFLQNGCPVRAHTRASYGPLIIFPMADLSFPSLGNTAGRAVLADSLFLPN